MKWVPAVLLLTGRMHISVDTMEQCSMTTMVFWGMTLDTEINCTNREYREEVHDDPKRYKDVVDDLLLPAEQRSTKAETDDPEEKSKILEQYKKLDE